MVFRFAGVTITVSNTLGGVEARSKLKQGNTVCQVLSKFRIKDPSPPLRIIAISAKVKHDFQKKAQPLVISVCVSISDFRYFDPYKQMFERLIENIPGTLVINEVFHSIQGESSHIGMPCVFVRLTYCNIRCNYCDTEYAFHEGKTMQIADILETVRSFKCKLVEVTGGEPLFQANVHDLLKQLCDEGFEVLLETGGSLDISTTDSRVKRIVDFKCPSSTMMKKNLWKNVSYLKRGDEVKFVIGNREDYDWSKEKIREYNIDAKCAVLMSVVFGKLEPLQLAEWVLKDNLNVRYQLQMHKYIWSPETRGV